VPDNYKPLIRSIVILYNTYFFSEIYGSFARVGGLLGLTRMRYAAQDVVVNTSKLFRHPARCTDWLDERVRIRFGWTRGVEPVSGGASVMV
jgi:hypothetical protein